MIIKFVTETGSKYEYDDAQRLVRRISGAHQPTLRQQQDLEWHECDSVSRLDGAPISIGNSAVIWWGKRRNPFIEGGQPTTMTSCVIEIARSE